MQHQLATISKWYILALIIVFPPVGFYFAVKYREEWVKKNWWFSMLVALYFAVLTAGIVLIGLGN